VLGSITAITGKNGNVVERYSYGAYANPYEGRFINMQKNNPYGFTGQRFEPELRMYSFAYRTYNPVSMRWLTPDPVRDRMNWYQYCLSDPVNLWDPLGLCDESGKPWTNIEIEEITEDFRVPGFPSAKRLMELGNMIEEIFTPINEPELPGYQWAIGNANAYEDYTLNEKMGNQVGIQITNFNVTGTCVDIEANDQTKRTWVGPNFGVMSMKSEDKVLFEQGEKGDIVEWDIHISVPSDAGSVGILITSNIEPKKN